MRCDECPFEKQPTVKSILVPGSDLMIIGEAPGREEVKTGTPFVGPSGKLLKRVLVDCGFKSSSYKVSLANALSCQLPRDTMINTKNIECCRERLHQEMDSVHPRLILALGNSALRSIFGSGAPKISSVNGTLMKLNGYEIIPCIHPASVLRNGSEYRRFHHAINLTSKYLSGAPVPHPGETKLWVCSPEDFMDILYKIPKYTNLGCDIETTGLSHIQDKIVSIGIAWEKNKVVILGKEICERAFNTKLNPYYITIKGFFEDTKRRFIWHNGKFDIKFFIHKGIQARVDGDTLLLHYALDEIKGAHDLESVATEYINAPEYKSEVKKYVKTGWRDCPDELFYTYLARDCDFTRQMFFPLMEALQEDEELVGLYSNTLLPASELLTQIELNGLWVNREKLDEIETELIPKMKEAEENFQTILESKIGPHERVNLNSSKQLNIILYEKMKFKVPKYQKPNTAHPTLIAMPPHPLINALLKYREINKQLSTYVRGLRKSIDPDTGRIHPSYNIAGTITGRLSSNNPNLQNIPSARSSNIRSVFQAPEGRVLLECDLDQAELRAAANISKDENMVKIYQDKRKLHHEVAISMYGPDYNSEEYRRAKALNFGVLYGRTASGLLKEFGGENIPAEHRLTAPQANKLIKEWFERFPGVVKYVEWCRRQPVEGQPIRSCTGRLRRYGLVTKDNLEELQNQASNYQCQSAASDINMLAAWRILPELEKWDSKIINLIHDSVLFEVPNDETTIKQISNRMAELFAEVGRNLMGDLVPFTAEAKTTKTWGVEQVSEVMEKIDATS